MILDKQTYVTALQRLCPSVRSSGMCTLHLKASVGIILYDKLLNTQTSILFYEHS